MAICVMGTSGEVEAVGRGDLTGSVVCNDLHPVYRVDLRGVT